MGASFVDLRGNPQVIWIMSGIIWIPLLVTELLFVACDKVEKLQLSTDERQLLISDSSIVTDYDYHSSFV